MLQLKALKEVIALFWPIIQQILKTIRDAETRSLAMDIKNAKTAEEKRDAARKIAESLYKR